MDIVSFPETPIEKARYVSILLAFITLINVELWYAWRNPHIPPRAILYGVLLGLVAYILSWLIAVRPLRASEEPSAER